MNKWQKAFLQKQGKQKGISQQSVIWGNEAMFTMDIPVLIKAKIKAI